MKLSQKQIILKVLEATNDFAPVWNLQSTHTDYGFLGLSGGRRCRELAAEGKLAVKHIKGVSHYALKREPVQEKLL